MFNVCPTYAGVRRYRALRADPFGFPTPPLVLVMRVKPALWVELSLEQPSALLCDAATRPCRPIAPAAEDPHDAQLGGGISMKGTMNQHVMSGDATPSQHKNEGGSPILCRSAVWCPGPRLQGLIKSVLGLKNGRAGRRGCACARSCRETRLGPSRRPCARLWFLFLFQGSAARVSPFPHGLARCCSGRHAYRCAPPEMAMPGPFSRAARQDGHIPGPANRAAPKDKAPASPLLCSMMASTTSNARRNARR